MSGVFAQDSKPGTPYSFSHPELTQKIDKITITAPDQETLIAEDLLASTRSLPYRIGVCVPVDISITNAGTWTEIPNTGQSLWRLTVNCKNAKSIGFTYNQFYLPDGALLYIYNKEKNRLIGAYTSENNSDDLFFTNQRISGDEVTLELSVPNHSKDAVKFQINLLDYFYRGETMNEKEISGSGSCEVNINCPEGANWQDEKKGVCLIDIKVGSNYYNCTGSLVNNTAGDCAPYVLLADHCHYDEASSSYASTADYNAWKFYFHNEATTCSGTTGPYNYTKTGCTLKAHDTYGSNGAGSDFCLVRINTGISNTLNVYYNGWDRNNTASTSGVGIHHPSGDIMKISTYTSSLTNYFGTHWQVVWASTVTNHGVTEQGSSGSPLFNNSGKIVGTLTGGSSQCTSPNSPDIYGKLYYHWDKNGTTSAKRLKDWLDPTNSGVTSLGGVGPCYAGIATNKSIEVNAVAYPSPASDQINFDLNSLYESVENLMVYNAQGAEVLRFSSVNLQSGVLSIDITGLSNGLYFVNATVDGKTFKSEFVKSK